MDGRHSPACHIMGVTALPAHNGYWVLRPACPFSPAKSRFKLAELMAALDHGDTQDIFIKHAAMGYVSEKQDAYVSRKMATIGFDRDDRETCEGYNLQVRGMRLWPVLLADGVLDSNSLSSSTSETRWCLEPTAHT